MQKLENQVAGWAKAVSEYKTVTWESLPDLELYMDQVITFMERQGIPLCGSGDKAITPSMINNYVKMQVIPRPRGKKYSKEHVAMLLMLCTLKQILSISDVSSFMMKERENDERLKQIYTCFREMQDQSFADVAGQIEAALCKQKESGEKENLIFLALRLSVEANTRRLAAQKIFDLTKEKEA